MIRVLSIFVLFLFSTFAYSQNTGDANYIAPSGPPNTGFYNTQVGVGVGLANTTGNSNTYLGTSAGSANTTGTRNIFIGPFAGFRNSTGYSNVFIGPQSGQTNLVGFRNIFIGNQAGDKTTSNNNIFIGSESGINNSSGEKNIFIGSDAGGLNTTATANIFVGTATGYKNKIGLYNTYVGHSAGYNSDSVNYVSLFGLYAGLNNKGSFNTFLGAQSGYTNRTGNSNSFFGVNSGYLNTTGSSNVFLGVSSGFKNTTSGGNVFIGTESGYENTINGGNTFLGNQSGRNNTGAANTYLGAGAGQFTSTGNWNTFVGSSSGVNTSGGDNTFLGHGTGALTTTGSANTFIGVRSGDNTTTGNWNTFLGNRAGTSNTSGGNNVFIGGFAGNNNTTGTFNVFLGHDAKPSTGNLTNASAIGYGSIVSASNSMVLGNNDIKVGIGTSTPQNKLEITGALNSSGLRFTNLKSTSTVSPSNNKALSVDANGDVILVNASTGSLSSIDSTVRKNIYFQSEGGSILTSQKLSILNNGMVGVGTSTPLTNFHVANGNIGIDLNQRLNLRASDPEGSYLTYTTNFTERTRLIAAYGLYLGSSGLDGITLKVGGNVGIGNTSPNAKLSIGKIAGDFGPNSKYLNSVYANSEVFKMYMDANWNTVLEAVQNTSNQSGLIFNTNNLERLRITNLGNIGIGTNNPRVKLQVTGDTRISGNLNIGDSLSNWIPFNVNQKTAYMYSARFAHSGSSENRQLSVAYKDGSIGLISSVFSTGNVSNLFLNSEGGNVGIGTSNPTTNLHVKANGNSTLKLEGSNVSMIHLAGNFGNALINNYNDGSLRINNIYDASSTHMVINSTGNVGIGTSLIPAGFKMAVKGSFIAEKVKVKNSNAWPDFVFKKDYILPSLSDIEKYVNQNSHLPEIPSAAEVEKDGQDLGEMNRLLLKKVEELTLYLIQQEKKSNIQEQKIKSLEAQNSEILDLKKQIATIKTLLEK